MQSGGCNFVVDPDADAREAAPLWLDEEHTLVRLVPMNNEGATCSRFDFWQLRCARTIVHDGSNLRVCVRAPRVTFSLHLDNALAADKPFGFVLPASDSLNEVQRTIAQFAALYAGKQPVNRSVCLERPPRSSLYHFRALQALDGVARGASQREIARVLLGSDAVISNWSSDSAMRAHVRALIQRGRRFVNGEYRTLIGNNNQFTQGVRV